MDRNYDRAAYEMKCSTLTISKFAFPQKFLVLFFMRARPIPIDDSALILSVMQASPIISLLFVVLCFSLFVVLFCFGGSWGGLVYL